MNASVVEIPFNRFLGLESTSSPASLLRLPPGPQYRNHLGTVHASALLALAEASSGEFLLRHFGAREGIIPVVRRVEAKFHKPARGAVTSSVNTPPDALGALDSDLAGKNRALISIEVALHDDSGAHVLTASIEWFIQRRTTN